MKFSFFKTTVLVAFLALFGASAAQAQLQEEGREDWPIHLRFLSGPQGGQWYDMSEPISEVLSFKVLPTSSRSGGGMANIEQINSRMGDLAFTLTGFMGLVASGEEEDASFDYENTAMIANVYPQVLYFLVRKDFAEQHGIASVDDLVALKKPISFASLRPGTASEYILRMVLKHGYNSSFDTLRAQGWTIQFNNYAETADNFAEGKIDCFAYTAGTNVPLIHTIEEYTKVLILPLGQNVMDILNEKFSMGTYTIKPGDYKCVTKPIPTLGDYTCIVARRDLPDSLVYDITKTLWEARASIGERTEDYKALSPVTAVPTNVEVHPGALRFWQELQNGK